MGVWKLYKDGDKVQLFNLREDIGETTDMSAQYPHIKERMLKAWNEWYAEIPTSASKVKK